MYFFEQNGMFLQCACPQVQVHFKSSSTKYKQVLKKMYLNTGTVLSLTVRG